MNVEDVRDYALTLGGITEELFAENWISFRIAGKWFLLIQLDAPEPRVAVKLPPETGSALRDEFAGVQPAHHMNKVHWNDLYLDMLEDGFVREQIRRSYDLVFGKLPKAVRRQIGSGEIEIKR